MGRGANRLLVLGLVAVASCGGGSSGGDDPAEEGFGPLAELMGWQPEEPAEMRRKELAREDTIAACMRAEGWEYEPVDYSAQMPDTQDEDIALMSDPKAYGERYGYGVVRNYELYEAEGLASGDGDMGMTFDDPNQDYVESLSSSEMEEYYATLSGGPEIWDQPDADGGENQVFVSPPLEDQGCSGQAQLEVYGEDPMQSNAEVQERLNEHFEDAQGDPRVEVAAEEWVKCMGDAIDGLEANGAPIHGPEGMYGYFDQRKSEAMGLVQEPYDENDMGTMEDVYTVTGDESGENQVAWVGTPEPISASDLEALRTEELAMWKVDFECQDDVDYRTIQRRIEQEFVDEIRDEFPELADQAAGAPAGS